MNFQNLIDISIETWKGESNMRHKIHETLTKILQVNLEASFLRAGFV